MTPKPTALKLRNRSRCLSITYPCGDHYELSWEYLRVFSPSAESGKHGQQSSAAIAGKEAVQLLEVKPAGHYAMQLVFDDGHDSGFYTWEYLYDLCVNSTTLWSRYLADLQRNGLSRDPSTQILKL
ncbi:MAG: gamma-butyrobetaine hydroxylase-like domain-containing protein [Pseudomonadota bacterium]